MPAYTQGLMDLGSSICSTRQPQCLICPVQKVCAANAAGEPERYPVKTRKLKRSSQIIWLLWAQKPDGTVWLERRPVPGVWGGLYCLPLFGSEEELVLAVPADARSDMVPAPPFLHVLTHKDLHLKPVVASLPAHLTLDREVALPQGSGGWFKPESWAALGLPAPIRKLLA